jgi:hypothetical protein
MSKPTLTSVTEQIHQLDTRSHRLEVETGIQFKDLFNRIKRIETILIAAFSAVIIILLTVALQL